mmetsp:Transcript_108476/g.221506  ORF Transcript_108476/g.221506 Transcript_108476/m.221506 type:complete len:223 (-) Transcript_108476:65-733(-)
MHQGCLRRRHGGVLFLFPSHRGGHVDGPDGERPVPRFVQRLLVPGPDGPGQGAGSGLVPQRHPREKRKSRGPPQPGRRGHPRPPRLRGRHRRCRACPRRGGRQARMRPAARRQRRRGPAIRRDQDRGGPVHARLCHHPPDRRVRPVFHPPVPELPAGRPGPLGGHGLHLERTAGRAAGHDAQQGWVEEHRDPREIEFQCLPPVEWGPRETGTTIAFVSCASS